MKKIEYIAISALLVLISISINAQTFYTVTKTTDPDPFVYEYNFDDNLCDLEMYGTLQWAIRKTNDTDGECVINFDIPGGGPHTISPLYYYPQITNTVLLDATTQAGYTEDNPAIILEGQNNIAAAFNCYNVDNIKIKGFRLNRFKSYGIILIGCNNSNISSNIITFPNPYYTLTKTGFTRIRIINCNNIDVYNNTLNAVIDGVFTTGQANLGLAFYNSNNCNVGSVESHFGNKIYDCYTGVLLNGSQNIKISANEIYNNENGILLENESNNSKKSPIILDYEEGVMSGIAEIGDNIEVFGSLGSEDAKEYLGNTIVDDDGNWSINLTTIYDYFISTATNTLNNTSEFSDAILVLPTCAKPINLSATEGISTSHTLSWDGLSGVIYNVAVGVKDLNPLDDNWMVSYSQVTDNSTTISGLDENTEYEFYINANCGTELSYWVGPVEFNPYYHESNGLSCELSIELNITDDLTKQSFQMQDTVIWFSFVATTENLQVLLNTSAKDNPAQIESVGLYKGSCNDLDAMTIIDNAYRILGGLIPGQTYTLKVKSTNVADFDICLSSSSEYPTNWYGRLYVKIDNYSFTEFPYYEGGDFCCNNDLIDLVERHNISKIYKPFDKLNSIELQKTYQMNFYSVDSINSLINELESLSYVEYAEVIPIDRIMVVPPSDYSVGNQWNLDIINAVDAWGELSNSQIQNEVIIAIVDNEVRVTHEDLSGNFWENNDSPGNNIDDDNNGFIDDFNGFDVADNDPNTSPPNSSFNHGTLVAGIAAGSTNNNDTDIASISWGAKIMAIKASHDISDPTVLENPWSGVEYAIANGADIINMSWGSIGSYSITCQNIINAGHDQGIIFVAAVGNGDDIYHIGFDLTDFPTYPALYDNVITVGATGTIDLEYDIISTFSNYGTGIDVMAPGYQILSTFSDADDSYGIGDGTSLACPLVSGLCALMLKYDPNLTPGAVQNCITSSCYNIDYLNLPIYSDKLGTGRINAYEAIKCLQTPPVPDFNSDNVLVCTNQHVHLHDNSTGAPMTSWHWTFSPNTVMCADPYAQNPEVQFLLDGEYTITLEVTNSLGTDIITKENYVIVDECIAIFSEQGNWYFGHNAAVDFSSGVAVSTQPSMIFSYESCASISDDAGDLLFYTDGQTIWNSNHQQMIGEGGVMNGCEGGGCTAAQGTLIVPDPSNPLKYYVFNVSEYTGTNFGLEYSIVNMEENNGLGDIIEINQSVPNNHFTSEHLSAIPHCNGIDYWIIVHTAEVNNNDNLLAYRLTPNGIIDPPVSSPSFAIDVLSPSYYEGIGQIDVSPNGELVSITKWSSEEIYIYQFDQQFGTFDLLTTISGGTGIYGTSFSPNSQLLYYIKKQPSLTNSDLIQYNFSDLANPTVTILENELSGLQYPSLQLGPDDRIYITAFGQSFLSVINNPNNINVGNTNLCNVVNEAIPLVQNNGPLPSCWYSFPNMIDAVKPNPNNPNFNYSISNCNTINLQPFPCGIIYEWDFGDGYTIIGNGDDAIPNGTNDGTTSGTYRYPSHTYSDNGLYEVTLSIGENSNTETVVVGVNIFASTTQTNCGECTGTSIASIAGGIPPYTCLWNDSPVNPQTTQTATGLCEGIYSLTVTDDNGCSAETTISIEEHIANIQISSTNPICENVCNGSVTIENIEGTPPYNIEWSNEETLYAISDLCSGTYSVTIIDANNCLGISSVSINGEYEIVSTISSNNISCFGNCDGNASVLATGGIPPYTYSWDDQNSQTNETAVGLCSDNYNVNVTDDNNCSATVSVDITEPPLLSASVQSLTNQICTTPGSATIVASGGTPSYTYNWPLNAGGVNDYSADALESGLYIVTIVDANNCEMPLEINIVDEGTILTVNSFVHQNPICYGDENGIIKVIVETGIPDFTIDWGETSLITSDYTTLISSLSAGTYSFIVTDDNGCTGETTTMLTDNPPVIATIINYSDVTCYDENDGSATVSATGGVGTYDYLWDDPEGQTTPTASVLSGGTYHVTVTDDLGCAAYASVTIWESTPIKPEIDAINVICFGDCDGSVTASATGGVAPYTFEWDDGQTDAVLINLCAGDYTVTITDSHGCTATASATVTENPQVEATITSSTVSCYGSNDGETTVTPTGGTGSYTYLWNDDENQETATATNLAPGTYTVTVNDSNFCEAYVNVTIDENLVMSALITEFTDCVCYENPNGSATVEAGGGAGGYTYLWNDQDNQENPTATGLIGGTYNVTVTDANNCEESTSVTIAGPSEEFIANAVFTNIACFGETSEVTITATGGTAPYTGTGVFNEIAGTHTYTVTDANECTTLVTVIVSEPSELTINSYSINHNSCYGYSFGQIMVFTSGGAPDYEFSIIEDNWQESPIFSSLSAGTYFVTVQDENGCTTESEPIVVNQPNEIKFNYEVTDNNCSGYCQGGIVVNSFGGSGNFHYEWNYDQWQYPVYTQEISNLCEGLYYLTVSEANDPNCFQTGAVLIESLNETPDVPQFEIPSCLYLNNVFQLTDNANTDPTLTWTWQIGDEVFVTNENTLNYEFPDYGYYCMSLTVGNNECGYESQTLEPIFVNPGICACDDSEEGFYDYDYTDGYTIFSYNNEIWSSTGTLYVEGDIYIQPNAILTIGDNTRIEFAPNARIIVMAEGKLIIKDDVTLTSIYDPLCENNMWQGIEVWGDNEFPHYMEKQGIVEILVRKDIFVENAHIAILLGARNMNHLCNSTLYPNPFDESKGCGLVHIAGSSIEFLNNGIGIKLLPREPLFSIGAFWSGNVIQDCILKTTYDLFDPNYSIYGSNPYPNSHNPWAGYANQYQRTDVGIYMNGIKGLDIRSCTFNNMQYAILSYDAKFNVYNSHFTKAIYGIKCENTTSTFLANHEISECYFDNIPGFLPPANYKLPTAAIYIKAGYNDYIHNNTFGYMDSEQKFNHFGIVTSNTSMFEITENVFRKFNRGIVTTSSGTNGGFIGAENNSLSSWYGNEFTHSWRSITTQGDNPKLRLKCNKSVNNNVDTDEYDVNYLNTGSLANQGSSSPLGVSNQKQRYPAGNEFFPDYEDSFKRIGSTNTYYTYYYHIGPDAVIPFIEPGNQDHINPNNTNAAFKISNEAACPDPVWGHIIVGVRLPDLTLSTSNLIMSYPFSIIDSLQNASDSLTMVRDNLIMNLDNGKTFELLNDIYGGTSTGKLKNKLISCSPLSDTVIYALLTEYPLSHGNFKNVMVLNLPVNRSIENLLYSVLAQIPHGIADQLIEMQAYNPFANTPGKLEQEIKDTELEKQLLFNRFIRLLTDTTHNRTEDVIMLLESEQSIDADKILAGTYIYVKDYQSAEDKISSIPGINMENEQFIEFNNMIISYLEQGKSLYAIDSTDLEFIWELAYECPLTPAGANAQSILSLLFRADFDDCPPAMGTRNVKNYNEDFYDNENNADIILGDNYPDPASAYTVIPYKLKDENGVLEISDASGKRIATYELNSGDNEFLLNTQAFAPGIYNYTLICKNGKIITKKLAIYR